VNIYRSRIANSLLVAAICSASQLMWQPSIQAVPTRQTCDRAINEIKDELKQQGIESNIKDNILFPENTEPRRVWPNAPHGNSIYFDLQPLPPGVNTSVIDRLKTSSQLWDFANKIIVNCPQTVLVSFVYGDIYGDGIWYEIERYFGKVNGQIQEFPHELKPLCFEWGYICIPRQN
jgi:hypothetical protein